MSPAASMWEGPSGPDLAGAQAPDDRPATRSAPWWAVSLAFHAVLLIVATIWIISTSRAEPAPPFTIVINPTPPSPRPIFDNGPKITPQDIIPEETTVESEIEFLVQAPPDVIPETPENLPNREVRGESLKFLSQAQYSGPANNGQIGIGGPPGGGYGSDLGGNRLRSSHRKTTANNAVLLALRWLARHQSADGGWNCAGFSRECGRAIRDGGSCGGPGYAEYDAGVTGLALLAFLGAGYTPISREEHDGIRFGTVVAKGLRRLAEGQEADGRIGGGSSAKPMYNHAIAALALAEGYGMTASPLLREPAQRAIDWLVRAQNPYKAWRYTEKSGDNDTSVAGWAVMALKSADISGLEVPKGAYDGARAWVDEVTGDDFRAGYTERGTGKVAVQGKNERYDHHEALTAAAMLIRAFTGARRDDPRLRGGTALLAADLPAHDGWRTDYYYWYYGSLALFQVDGATGSVWTKWVADLEKALLPTQRPRAAGCAFGSWDTNERWSFEGGRVYATAINALTLEVNYRYKNVFGVR